MATKSTDRRAYTGAVFRLTLDFIKRKGMYERLEPDFSPETRALVAKPPGVLSWIDCAAMDELEALLEKHGGKKAAYDLGVLAGREFGGGLIQPVIKMALALFARTPATMLGNAERFYPLVTKGYHTR